MALKDLFFTIFAKDKTSQAFTSVNKRLRETEGHARTLSERMNRTGKAMRNLGAQASIGSASIAAIFRGSIDLYDEQARAEAKVAQAIETTGGAADRTKEELFDMASGLQRLTRFGDEDILNKVTAQLLTFKNVSGESFDRAQMAALDLATTLDGDLQSAAIMLGKALNDPVKGLSAMSRAGVTFSEEQQKVIKALAQTGDIAQAQKLILDEIASAYGGQARAAATAGAGIRDQWRNTWGDVKEEVGGVLLEGLLVVLPVLQSIADAFDSMSPGAKRFTVIVGALAVALPPLTAALGVLVIGISALSAPVIATGTAIAALTAAVVAFAPKLWEMADGIRDAFSRIPEWAQGMVQGVIDALSGLLDPFLVVRRQVEAVEASFAWLYDRVVGNSWVPDMVDEIGQHFGRLGEEMTSPTEKAAAAVDGSFSTLADDVSGRLSTLARDGKLTWDGFLGALEDSARARVDAITGQVFDKLTDRAFSGVEGFVGSIIGGGGSGSGSGGGSGGGGFLSGIGGALKNLAGFDTGGAFTVRGRAGMDRNVAAVRLSEGERVEVLRRGERPAQVINFHISTPDAEGFRRSQGQIAARYRAALSASGRVS